MTWHGGFQNPVTELLPGQVTTGDLADGAVTSIKLNQNLQSDNYVSGSSGWRILRNTGDVEFNDGTFRGTITAARFQTDSTGERLEIRGDVDEPFMRFYDSSNVLVGKIGLDLFVPSTDLGLEAEDVLILNGKGSTSLRSDNGSIFIRTITGGSNTVQIFVGSNTVLTARSTSPYVSLDETRVSTELEVSDGFTSTFVGANSIYASGTLHLGGGGQGGIDISTSGILTFPARNDGFFALFLKGHPTTSASANLVVRSDDRMAKSTSSRDYKTAIRPWDSRHSVLDLEPSLYRSTADGDDSRRVRLGLIAENVADKFPLGFAPPDGVDWNPIIAGVIAELQKTNERIERLEHARRN